MLAKETSRMSPLRACTRSPSLFKAGILTHHTLTTHSHRVDKIKRYVPKKFLGDSNVNASLVKKIIEARTTLGKMEADKAMDSYLKYVKGWKIYGSAFFYVEPQSAHTHLPESVFLAVNPKGVLLINFDTKVRKSKEHRTQNTTLQPTLTQYEPRPAKPTTTLQQEILAEHPYSEVPTWGFSSTTFVLHIGNLVRQTKIYFQTMQVCVCV